MDQLALSNLLRVRLKQNTKDTLCPHRNLPLLILDTGIFHFTSYHHLYHQTLILKTFKQPTKEHLYLHDKPTYLKQQMQAQFPGPKWCNETAFNITPCALNGFIRRLCTQDCMTGTQCTCIQPILYWKTIFSSQYPLSASVLIEQ